MATGGTEGGCKCIAELQKGGAKGRNFERRAVIGNRVVDVNRYTFLDFSKFGLLSIYLLPHVPSFPWHPDFDKEKTHLYFKKLFLKYGPIVRVKFPGQPTLVMLNNPEDVHTIFQATMTNPYREPMGSVKKARYDDEYYEEKAGLVAE